MRHRRRSRRRIPRALGAAAGGLLGAAFLPAGAAFADDWDVVAAPGAPEYVTGIYGDGFGSFDLVPPAVQGSTQGYQEFDYTNTTTDDSGTFEGLESNFNDGLGDTGQQVYVASDTTGTGAPSVGSVFDTYSTADGAIVNVYSDIYSPSGGTITDTVETPFGNYNIPVTFDAADSPVADAGGVTIGYSGEGFGTDIVPVGSQDVDAITGISPLTVALQGTQQFAIDGTKAFDADNTITQDGLGTYTEALLVTKDLAGTVGTAAGDTPAVGSIINTINYGDMSLVYSDLLGSNGTYVLTDNLDTPLGNYVIPTDFAASQVEDTQAIDVPGGTDLTPVGTLDPTGINGLPPVDVGVQGTQDFDYTNADGTTGQFTADVTNTLDTFDDYTQTVLVTSNADPDAPEGSTFATVTWGDTGFENIYSDIVSTTGGADTITDTMVTPLGDITIPNTFDLAAGLATDLFGSI